jgi:fido (protein-threonine AMPylation protein)
MQQLNLNERQQKIIDFIAKSGPAGNAKISAFLGNGVSRFTVLRDIELLLKAKLIEKEGKGRAVRYSSVLSAGINAFFDPDLYFKKEVDERSINPVFNLEIINEFPNLFSKDEVAGLLKINEKYLKRTANADKSFLKKEIERLVIELSWKSSRLEGNTYTLFDTEILIKDKIEAKGHTKEEAIMILNHKNAIDYIFTRRGDFKKMNIRNLERVHELLTRNLAVPSGIRNVPVRIIGTRYLPISGRTKIVGALDKVFTKINALNNPFSKALATLLMISYIQAFADGNKRTARIMANVVLLAHGVCPISYRSVDEADYKKAMILFYEQNSARFFKELFVGQFKFAVDNYF